MEDKQFKADPKHKNDTLSFFRRYPDLVTYMLNIYEGMSVDNYDFPMVICGEVGNGKSMFVLHFIELWYRVVLRQRLTFQHIRHLQKTRDSWIANFKKVEKFDINANDEGTNSLMSKESMTKFNITLNKLYNVCRKKLIMTPILIPDYFELPTWYRKRIRCAIEIDKRGFFNVYDKQSLSFANAFNMSKPIKTLKRVRPYLKGCFPDYMGVLRDPYDADESKSVDEILDHLVVESKFENYKSEDVHYSRVSTLINQGMSHADIAKKLKIGTKTISKIRNKMLMLENA